MKIKFDTRQVFSRQMEAAKIPPTQPESGTEDAEKPVLFSFIMGIDQHPRPIPLAETQKLGDRFTQDILLKGKKPLTLDELITAITSFKDDAALPMRKMFLVAEGGQHHINHSSFELNARIVFSWQKSNAHPPDILLSTVPVLHNNESLLQLIAWSNTDNAFHFFERRSGVWAWAGNSFFALDARSRGKGPFDSHINGGLVMKELKAPWAHWHSQASTISRLNFPADSEFNTAPLFSVLNQAEELESIVRTGVRRWTKSRIQRNKQGSAFNDLPAYFRQIVAPSSVNLTSSDIEFHQAQDVVISLPSTFFFDLDGIEFASMELDQLSQVVPAGRLSVNGALYKNKALEMNMNIESEEGTKFKGDTHFCFLVPERAFEDLEVAKQLVQQSVISARLLLCILLVDFANPVDSAKRNGLLKYCPASLTGSPGNSFDEVWVQAIRNAGAAAGSGEAEFLSYWDDTQLLQKAQEELHDFFNTIQQNLSRPAYVEQLIRLAEYRKQVFSRSSFGKLNEFRSTLSHTENPPKKWEMDKRGNIITI
jgi:hypothetical protein